MTNKKILVVDDDENVTEILSLYLKKENFKVITANNGIKALDKVESYDPALIILDIMMPEMDGIEVVKKLREKTQIPVIFLSAKSEEFDRILGLELGADDYVTKPFSPREVVTRVKVILKRVNNKNNLSNKKNIKYPDLVIDHLNRKVKVKNKVIDLSPKEYELLLLLVKHPQQVFSREKLYDRIWGIDSFGDLRSVDVHINWIRNKLKLDYIKTVWGVGYKFEVEEDD
jgi:two-component system response regulator ResD